MKSYFEKRDVVALFYRSYFLYTRIAFVKNKTEEQKAQINAYRTIIKILGQCSNRSRVRNDVLLNGLRHYVVESESIYVKAFVSVIDETIRFIYENVLIEKREHSLHRG